jgi:hypothetical protein
MGFRPAGQHCSRIGHAADAGHTARPIKKYYADDNMQELGKEMITEKTWRKHCGILKPTVSL